MEILIAVIFLAEIGLRFLAEPHELSFFRSAWNLFGTPVVAVSPIPIDNSDMALVARLVRGFRVLGMVSIIPELRMLLGSLLKALPQLGYVILLMFVIFYTYGAIGATLFESINPNLWSDIAISMLTLFRVNTFEDWTDVMYETVSVYPLSELYNLSFIFFTAFASLNMVIGIVVNAMNVENEKLLKAQAEEAHEPTLRDIHQRLDRPGQWSHNLRPVPTSRRGRDIAGRTVRKRALVDGRGIGTRRKNGRIAPARVN